MAQLPQTAKTANTSAKPKASANANLNSSIADQLYVSGFKPTIIVILVLLAIVIIVIVVMYIVSRIKANKLQQVVLHTDTLKLDNAKEVPFKVPNATMSLVTAGHEFSYNFWIYLGSNYASTAGHKLILERGYLGQGSIGSSIDYNTNPTIFLDKNTNKLYVALATNKVTGNDIGLDDILTRDANGKYISGFIVTYIDYLPLQRWVNIGLTVRDNTGYLFMDGDLYSVVTVNDLLDSSNPVRPIIKGTNGDLLIGNRVNNTSGFMSHTSYFNYALTQNEIKALYSKGPYPKTMLSYLGLGSYALRSPVYRLDA